MDFFKNWDDRGSLERSLPVVNWGFELIFSKIGDDRGPLERSLPVVSWDSKIFSGMRTVAPGS